MTINEAPPVVPYPPVPPYGPGAPAPLPYPAPPRRRRGVLGAVAALGVVGVLAGVGVGAYAAGRNSTSSTPPAPAGPAPAAGPAAPVLSPEDAQAQTCGVLKANYQAVANAIDERNKFDKAPWSDPGLLGAVNTLVSLGMSLAEQLDASLSPSTPPQLRTAVVEYVAGLRAMSISERNHASNVQLNGSGLLYNQVVDAPLKLCGIPG